MPLPLLFLCQTKVRELQQELADSLKKQSMSEAFLEVNTRYRTELEEEKSRLSKDLERLRGKVPVNPGSSLHCQLRVATVRHSEL